VVAPQTPVLFRSMQTFRPLKLEWLPAYPAAPPRRILAVASSCSCFTNASKAGGTGGHAHAGMGHSAPGWRPRAEQALSWAAAIIQKDGAPDALPCRLAQGGCSPRARLCLPHPYPPSLAFRHEGACHHCPRQHTCSAVPCAVARLQHGCDTLSPPLLLCFVEYSACAYIRV
jgi:hypothetical protein